MDAAMDAAVDADAFEPEAFGARTAAKCHFAGAAFDPVTMAEAIERIDGMLARRRSAMVVTANVDHLLRMRHNPSYAELVARADLVLADGQPIVWATRLLKRSLPMRVAGSDLFPKL